MGMKKIGSLLQLVIYLISFGIFAQEYTVSKNYFQIAPRIGYDFPTYSNNTPYISYKSGLELGISLDYYWNWIGLGADFDYINNTPKNLYPTTKLSNATSLPLTTFNNSETSITRTFYGIGPSFKYQTKTGKFTAELNTRIGYGSVSGGETQLNENTSPSRQMLNYHSGYTINSVLSAKGQVRFTYFFAKRWGLQLGVYYLKHFDAKEDLDKSLGFSAAYQTFSQNASTGETNLLNNPINTRKESCHCDIFSEGIFIGVAFKIPSQSDVTKIDDCIQYPLTVRARDKFTKELLPNTDVVVKDTQGNVIKTARTNSFGVVVFDNVAPDNYTIEGALNSIAFEPTTIKKSELKPGVTLQKEIIFADLNLILVGSAVVCNTTTPIGNVTVTLKNAVGSEEKTTITDSIGHFTFPIKTKSKYLLYGKKENYFSQTETISSQDYDRNVTLFVKVKLCLEEADCGKAIALKNILYDLDKYFIREESKKELNRLVQFMVDNPGVKVEVSSHTDSRASNEYNQTLSQNRANAAVDYMVSQGIARERLKGVGYGESKLLNECADGINCTEEQHQLNRRTEMKVICPEKKQ